MKIVEEESELYRERSDTTEYQTQDFVPCAKVQRAIVAEMKKSASYCKDPVLKELAEDMLIEAVQVVYEAPKDGIKTPLFNVIEDIIVEIIQKGMMNSPLMRSLESLTQSVRIRDALMQRVAGFHDHTD